MAPARSCTRIQLFDIMTSVDYMCVAGANAFSWVFFSLLVLTPMVYVMYARRIGQLDARLHIDCSPPSG